MNDKNGTDKKFDNLYFILLSGKAGVGKDYIASKVNGTLTQRFLTKRDIGFSTIKSYGYYLRKELDLLTNRVYIDYTLRTESTNVEYMLRKIANDFNLSYSDVLTICDEYGDRPNLFDAHKDPRYRDLMQWYGTDVRRKQNSDYWVNKLIFDNSKNGEVDNISNISRHLAAFHPGKQGVIIITDVRFINEYAIPKRLFKNVVFYSIVDSTSTIEKREVQRDTKPMTTVEKAHISEHGLDSFDNYDFVFDRSELTSDEIVNYICNRAKASAKAYTKSRKYK